MLARALEVCPARALPMWYGTVGLYTRSLAKSTKPPRKMLSRAALGEKVASEMKNGLIDRALVIETKQTGQWNLESLKSAYRSV
jgi:hypothetical protein